MAVAKKKWFPLAPPAPQLEMFPLDALVNSGFDFPMSGDGTEDKNPPEADVFVNGDLDYPMG